MLFASRRPAPFSGLISAGAVAVALSGAGGALVLACGALGCSARAHDVAGDRKTRTGITASASATAAPDSGIPAPPKATAGAPASPSRLRPIVRADARALAVDADNLYYGDTDEDAVVAMPKAGGEPKRLARHAPVAGALAAGQGALVWIASPGDAVLRVSVLGGPPTTLREHGIFSGVAMTNGDVFIAEAQGAGGSLTRVTGTTASRVASFDGAPRGVAADEARVYVVTANKVLRGPLGKGELEPIAAGTGFTRPEMDAAFLYLIADVESARAVVRVPKAGGPMTVVARRARDAPIAVEGGELFFFDAGRSELRAVATSGGDARVLASGDALSSPNAMVADASTVYVATGLHEGATVFAVARR